MALGSGAWGVRWVHLLQELEILQSGCSKSRNEETLKNTWCALHNHFPDYKTKIRMQVAADTCKELTGPLTKAKHRPQS